MVATAPCHDDQHILAQVYKRILEKQHVDKQRVVQAMLGCVAVMTVLLGGTLAYIAHANVHPHPHTPTPTPTPTPTHPKHPHTG